MADSKLDDLTAASPLDGTERVYIVQDISATPSDRKTTVADIAALATGGGTVLTADTTFYVNPVSGSDSNDGLNTGTAWATTAHAISQMAGIDAAGFNVTINLADETFTATGYIVDVYIRPRNCGTFSIVGTTATILDGQAGTEPLVRLRNDVVVDVLGPFTYNDGFVGLTVLDQAVALDAQMNLSGANSSTVFNLDNLVNVTATIDFASDLILSQYFAYERNGSRLTYSIGTDSTTTRSLASIYNIDSTSSAVNLTPAKSVPVAYAGINESRVSATANTQFNVRTINAEVTFSSGNPCVCTWTAHGLKVNDLVSFRSVADVWPTGFANTQFQVLEGAAFCVLTVPSPDTFTFSDTFGGTPIATSDTGSGTYYGVTGCDANEGTNTAAPLFYPYEAINKAARIDADGFDVSIVLGLKGSYQGTLYVTDPNYEHLYPALPINKQPYQTNKFSVTCEYDFVSTDTMAKIIPIQYWYGVEVGDAYINGGNVLQTINVTFGEMYIKGYPSLTGDCGGFGIAGKSNASFIAFTTVIENVRYPVVALDFAQVGIYALLLSASSTTILPLVVGGSAFVNGGISSGPTTDPYNSVASVIALSNFDLDAFAWVTYSGTVKATFDPGAFTITNSAGPQWTVGNFCTLDMNGGSAALPGTPGVTATFGYVN